MFFEILVRLVCCACSSMETHVPIIQSSRLTVHKNKPLGAGSFGDVYHGTLTTKKGEVSVAVKVPNQNSVSIDTWLQEVFVLGGRKHPNVVHYLGMSLRAPFIIMEKYSKGSLYDLIRSVEFQSFSWADKMKLAIGIAKGMKFLHSRNKAIVHRDLKSSNILLSEDFTPVVADLGPEWTGDVKKLGGPHPAHQAPEVALEGKKATTKSDVYSFAIIMWEIMTGGKPWSGMRTLHVYGQLVHQERPTLPEHMPCNWSGWASFVNLMERCWSQEPDQRPTFKTILGELESLHPQQCQRVKVYNRLISLCHRGPSAA